LIFLFRQRACLVLHVNGRGRQISFFAKILVRNRHWQFTNQATLPVSGFIAVPLHIPRKDSDLIKVVRHAVFGLGEQHQVFRNFLVAVLDFVQGEGCDNPLAFGVLCYVERRVNVQHATQHPPGVALWIAHQPPVFQVHRFAVGVRLVFLLAGQQLGSCLALEHGNVAALGKLVKMVAVAVRREMDIGIVARDAGGLDRIVLLALLELLEAVIHLLSDQITLLNPTLHTGGGPHLHIAAVAVQYFHAFGVFYHAHLVVNRRNLITEKRLRRGNVSGFSRVSMMVATSRENYGRRKNKKQRASDCQRAAGSANPNHEINIAAPERYGTSFCVAVHKQETVWKIDSLPSTRWREQFLTLLAALSYFQAYPGELRPILL